MSKKEITMNDFICNIVCLYLRDNSKNNRSIEKHYFSNTCYNYLSDEYSIQIASYYQSILNNYASNFSNVLYQWSYYTNDSDQDSYVLFKETSLEYLLRSPYNVTKNFATYCPAGSTVYSSSSDDSDIKTVTCKDGNKYNIIIINLYILSIKQF
jgi:hypothetical protein